MVVSDTVGTELVIYVDEVADTKTPPIDDSASAMDMVRIALEKIIFTRIFSCCYLLLLLLLSLDASFDFVSRRCR